MELPFIKFENYPNLNTLVLHEQMNPYDAIDIIDYAIKIQIKSLRFYVGILKFFTDKEKYKFQKLSLSFDIGFKDDDSISTYVKKDQWNNYYKCKFKVIDHQKRNKSDWKEKILIDIDFDQSEKDELKKNYSRLEIFAKQIQYNFTE